MTLYSRSQDAKKKRGGSTGRKAPKKVQALAQDYARATALRLLGFREVYAAAGYSAREMVDREYLGRSTVYKTLAEFRDFFGVEPEDFDPSPSELLVILYGDRAPSPAEESAE